MPVYEYECSDCERVTEALRPIRDADEPIDCEHCGGRRTHRAHSVFAAGASSGSDQSLPMAGCGRCGEAGGSCPYQ